MLRFYYSTVTLFYAIWATNKILKLTITTNIEMIQKVM